MKKSLSLILALIMLFCLSSCEKSPSPEIKNRAIVQGIGLDLIDGSLSVSFQLINTDVTSNASAQSGPDSPVKCYTLCAESLSEALQKLEELDGKRPLVCQNRLLVFGKALAKKGIEPYLDEFLRNTESRFTILCAVAERKAEDIICINTGKNIIPARLCESIITSRSIGVLSTELYSAVNCIAECDKDFALPLLRAESKSVSCVGTAVFSGSKLKLISDIKTASGINLALEKQTDGVISFGFDTDVLNFEIIKTKPHISIRNNEVRIQISAKLRLKELSTNKGIKNSAETLEELRIAAENEIEKTVENSLKICTVQNGCDVLGLTNYANRKNHMKTSIDKNCLSNISYRIDADVSIVNTGDFSVNLY